MENQNSNTTLVKVKLAKRGNRIIYKSAYSNTTLVKVKFNGKWQSPYWVLFKYNTC